VDRAQQRRTQHHHGPPGRARRRLELAALGGHHLDRGPEHDVTSETESKRANELLLRAFPQDRAARERDITEVVVVRARRGGGIAEGAANDRVQALADELRAAGASAVVTSAEGTPLTSRDGDARAVLVGLGFDGEDDVPAVYDVVQRLDDEPGYEAAITGELTSDADQGELSGDDLRTGELFFGSRPHW
jgi:hypothetical protein